MVGGLGDLKMQNLGSYSGFGFGVFTQEKRHFVPPCYHRQPPLIGEKENGEEGEGGVGRRAKRQKHAGQVSAPSPSAPASVSASAAEAEAEASNPPSHSTASQAALSSHRSLSGSCPWP